MARLLSSASFIQRMRFLSSGTKIQLISLLMILMTTTGLSYALNDSKATSPMDPNFKTLAPGSYYGDACGNGMSNAGASYNSVEFTIDKKGCILTASIQSATIVSAAASNVAWSVQANGNLGVAGNNNQIVVAPSANGFFLTVNGNGNTIRLGSTNGNVNGNGLNNKVVFP